MSNFDQGASARSDEALERLLSRASPRPMPSESDEVAVREAVRAEWQVVSGQQRSRRRIAGFAIAATVLIAVFSIFSVFRLPVLDVVQVATIQKEFGSIYLLAETSELRETQALSRVLAGQTIVTGDEAGMALAWGAGGSLRMDANTRVRFLDSSSIQLESGRVYFDSRPSPLMAGIGGGGAPDLLIVSEHGEVTHVGTQFMTQVDDGELTVSVREGQVFVDGQYQKYVASSGQQVTMAGRAQPIVLSISATAAAWDWVSRTSPVTDVEGKSLHEFLLWACRETGLELRYEGDAEQVARHEAILKGKIDAEPMDALRLRLDSAALEWSIVEGVIVVNDK
ncbi:MAG: FecR family protein [Woeseiaceae bacterium]